MSERDLVLGGVLVYAEPCPSTYETHKVDTLKMLQSVF